MTDLVVKFSPVRIDDDVDGSENLEKVEAGGQKSISIEPGDRKSPDLHWANVSFKVKEKHILRDCWGIVPSGKICAILGPSGAGKSSLLNVLAGRSGPAAGVSISGKFTVGGQLVNPVSFRRNIAYVMQDDALMATATPREAITFSASMRLPSTTTKEQINELVDHTLTALGISECADVMIGGSLIKGISGGQRKRTSVGIEIVTKPLLLFLDEPTSGLDSFSAFSLVNLLKKIAKRDCTILFTIHQPSSEVFFLFDLAIFMKDGRIFYQGPVKNIVSHFSQFGYLCPSQYNPSDFIMTLTQAEALSVLEEKKMFMTAPSALLEEVEKFSSQQVSGTVSFTSQRSFFRQLVALTYREMLSVGRDTTALGMRFGSSAFLSILFGIIFLNAGSRDNGNSTNFGAHFGALAMVLISGMFGQAQPVMLAFPYERPMFMREYSTGTYGVVAYFLSKLILEIPLSFVQSVESMIICFYMLDLQGSFIVMVAAMFALGECSCSVALCLGCLLPNVKDVTEMAPLLFVPQMLFVGFFISTSSIPIFLRWAQYLCSLKYSMNIVLLSEFSSSNKSCQGDDASRNCAAVLAGNQIHTEDMYIYVILLFAIFAAFRIVAGLILVQKAKKFY